MDGNADFNVIGILMNTDMMSSGNVAYRSDIQCEQQQSEY